MTMTPIFSNGQIIKFVGTISDITAATPLLSRDSSTDFAEHTSPRRSAAQRVGLTLESGGSVDDPAGALSAAPSSNGSAAQIATSTIGSGASGALKRHCQKAKAPLPEREPKSKTRRLTHFCKIPNCGKSFRWKSRLILHMRTHLNQRPFKCIWANCNKAFVQKAHMLGHLTTHTREKLFKCCECGREFGQLYSLRRHLKLVHQEKVRTV